MNKEGSKPPTEISPPSLLTTQKTDILPPPENSASPKTLKKSVGTNDGGEKPTEPKKKDEPLEWHYLECHEFSSAKYKVNRIVKEDSTKTKTNIPEALAPKFITTFEEDKLQALPIEWIELRSKLMSSKEAYAENNQSEGGTHPAYIKWLFEFVDKVGNYGTSKETASAPTKPKRSRDDGTESESLEMTNESKKLKLSLPDDNSAETPKRKSDNSDVDLQVYPKKSKLNLECPEADYIKETPNSSNASNTGSRTSHDNLQLQGENEECERASRDKTVKSASRDILIKRAPRDKPIERVPIGNIDERPYREKSVEHAPPVKPAKRVPDNPGKEISEEIPTESLQSLPVNNENTQTHDKNLDSAEVEAFHNNDPVNTLKNMKFLPKKSHFYKMANAEGFTRFKYNDRESRSKYTEPEKYTEATKNTEAKDGTQTITKVRELPVQTRIAFINAKKSNTSLLLQNAINKTKNLIESSIESINQFYKFDLSQPDPIIKDEKNLISVANEDHFEKSMNISFEGYDPYTQPAVSICETNNLVPVITDVASTSHHKYGVQKISRPLGDEVSVVDAISSARLSKSDFTFDIHETIKLTPAATNVVARPCDKKDVQMWSGLMVDCGSEIYADNRIFYVMLSRTKSTFPIRGSGDSEESHGLECECKEDLSELEDEDLGETADEESAKDLLIPKSSLYHVDVPNMFYVVGDGIYIPDEVPKVPLVEVPKVPLVEVPKVPLVEVPKVPLVEVPKVPDDEELMNSANPLLGKVELFSNVSKNIAAYDYFPGANTLRKKVQNMRISLAPDARTNLIERALRFSVCSRTILLDCSIPQLDVQNHPQLVEFVNQTLPSFHKVPDMSHILLSEVVARKDNIIASRCNNEEQTRAVHCAFTLNPPDGRDPVAKDEKITLRFSKEESFKKMEREIRLIRFFLVHLIGYYREMSAIDKNYDTSLHLPNYLVTEICENSPKRCVVGTVEPNSEFTPINRLLIPQEVVWLAETLGYFHGSYVLMKHLQPNSFVDPRQNKEQVVFGENDNLYMSAYDGLGRFMTDSGDEFRLRKTWLEYLKKKFTTSYLFLEPTGSELNQCVFNGDWHSSNILVSSSKMNVSSIKLIKWNHAFVGNCLVDLVAIMVFNGAIFENLECLLQVMKETFIEKFNSVLEGNNINELTYRLDENRFYTELQTAIWQFTYVFFALYRDIPRDDGHRYKRLQYRKVVKYIQLLFNIIEKKVREINEDAAI